MTKRPALDVSAPDFGVWLKRERGTRSLEQIARKIRPYVSDSGQKVNRASLHQFEQGRVPNWPMLAAYAKVFETPLPKLLQILAASLEFPGSRNLISDLALLPSAIQKGSADHGAHTRIQELEEELISYRAIVQHAHELGEQLLQATGDRTEGSAAPRAKRKRGRRS